MELDLTPLEGRLGEYDRFELKLVETAEQDELWNGMVKEYHYLGLQKIIGPRIKYLIYLGTRPVGAISYHGGSLKLGARDKYIGWDDSERIEQLRYVINQNRFLLLPAVKVKYLASHILSRSLKQVRKDWKDRYGYEPCVVETFVSADRYKGTCYHAAGWERVGETKGYSREGKKLVYHGNKKHIFVKVLNQRFVKTFQTRQPPKTKREEDLAMQLAANGWNAETLKDAGIDERSIAPIAELYYEYLHKYKDCFQRTQQMENFVLYLKGLASELERKSVEPIAIVVGKRKDFTALIHFLSKSTWDDKQIRDIYKKDLYELLSEPDGMLTVDGCDFPKKGNSSPGVARQHCGPLGKTDNCQASVMVGYTGYKGYGLIDGKLYLPEKWFGEDYKERWKQCKIPDDTPFKDKLTMATEMLNEAAGLFQGKWIGADSTFGSDSKFLDNIPKGYYYFADVRKNQRVFAEMPDVFVPEWSGHGPKPTVAKPSVPSITVEELVAGSEKKWERVKLGEGSKGPIYAEEMCLSVVEVRNKLPGKPVWLYVRKLENGDIKYTLSNAPQDASIELLRKQALRRWPIEQSFEECKSDLGMDHFEGRSWSGWHRHILLVFIDHLFFTLMRKRFAVPIHKLAQDDINDAHVFIAFQHGSSHVPVLTFTDARLLFNGALIHQQTDYSEKVRIVNHNKKRKAVAYRSHKKMKLLRDSAAVVHEN